MGNLGLKNLNPGNLKDPKTGAFRQFSSATEGLQALLEDLKTKQSGQSHVIKPGASLEQFAEVWAPASDKNDPHQYAQTLAKVLGVSTAHAFDQIPTEDLAKAVQVAEGTTDLKTGTQTEAPSLNHALIKANVLKLQNAGAPPQDIEEYVKRAVQEQGQTTHQTFSDSVKQIQDDKQPDPEAPKKRGLLGSIIHGLVEPVATTLARPIQAGAELLGASDEKVNEVTKKLAGDYVAPTPKSGTDVLKDAGRAGETVLLGAGLSKGTGLIKSAMGAKDASSAALKEALAQHLASGGTLEDFGGQAVKTASKFKGAFKTGLGFGAANAIGGVAKSGAEYIKNKLIDNSFQKKY